MRSKREIAFLGGGAAGWVLLVIEVLRVVAEFLKGAFNG